MDERSRKIAKNTVLLYVRSIIMVIVGLYTSRIMLEALGIDNYGINNVVGGIVAFSSLITGTMTAATSRYITYALGEGNLDKMKVVFTTTVNVHLGLALIAVLVLEIAGVWYLNTTANIPPNRLYAANWVLQCAVISLFLSILTSPYGACIVAHEHMGIFAFMGLFDVIIKLGVCFAVLYYNGDKLIFFSVLSLIIGTLLKLFFALYSRYHFDEVRYRFIIDKALLKEMSVYSGWTLLNGTSWMFCSQGVSLLINYYYGVAYNASRAIADSVNTAVQGLVNNVTTAFNPQITKSYAAKDYDYCYKTVNRSIKFTWFMSLLFMVPICTEAKTLLKLWLVDVPPMATLFLQFVMFQSLSLQSGQNLLTLIQANGNMKLYTIIAFLYAGLVFPLTWIAFHFNAPVWVAYPIFIFIFFTINIFRLMILRKLTTYPWQSYVFNIFVPCLKITIISFIIPIAISFVWSDSILKFFVMVPLCVMYTAFIIYFMGLQNYERVFVKEKINSYLINKLHIHIKALS